MSAEDVQSAKQSYLSLTSKLIGRFLREGQPVLCDHKRSKLGTSIIIERKRLHGGISHIDASTIWDCIHEQWEIK